MSGRTWSRAAVLALALTMPAALAALAVTATG